MVWLNRLTSRHRINSAPGHPPQEQARASPATPWCVVARMSGRSDPKPLRDGREGSESVGWLALGSLMPVAVLRSSICGSIPAMRFMVRGLARVMSSLCMLVILQARAAGFCEAPCASISKVWLLVGAPAALSLSKGFCVRSRGACGGLWHRYPTRSGL